MLPYSLKCRKNTESKKLRVSKTKNGKPMLLSKCEVCGSKKLRFIKEQDTCGLLSNLRIKTPLSKIPILGHILFLRYKTNETIDKFLLAGNKFMP